MPLKEGSGQFVIVLLNHLFLEISQKSWHQQFGHVLWIFLNHLKIKNNLLNKQKSYFLIISTTSNFFLFFNK